MLVLFIDGIHIAYHRKSVTRCCPVLQGAGLKIQVQRLSTFFWQYARRKYFLFDRALYHFYLAHHTCSPVAWYRTKINVIYGRLKYNARSITLFNKHLAFSLSFSRTISWVISSALTI